MQEEMNMPQMIVDAHEVIEALLRYNQYAVQFLTENVQEAADKIEERVKENIVNTFQMHTGKLYNSVGQTKYNEWMIEVHAAGGEAYYGIFQEFGFRHKKGDGWEWVQHPFFYPAVQDVANEMGAEVNYTTTEKVPPRVPEILKNYQFNRISKESFMANIPRR